MPNLNANWKPEITRFSRSAAWMNSGTVFFTANKGDPREEKIFSIALDGSGMQALSSEPGHDAASIRR